MKKIPVVSYMAIQLKTSQAFIFFMCAAITSSDSLTPNIPADTLKLLSKYLQLTLTTSNKINVCVDVCISSRYYSCKICRPFPFKTSVVIRPNVSLTYDTFGEGGPLQCGQSQVSDLHRARGPRDEDVVALQVPVDDGRGPGVQEVETFKDLPAP